MNNDHQATSLGRAVRVGTDLSGKGPLNKAGMRGDDLISFDFDGAYTVKPLAGAKVTIEHDGKSEEFELDSEGRLPVSGKLLSIRPRT